MAHLRRFVRVPSPSLIVAVAALLVATSGAALAAIPDADGVIHGCINNRTGVLRVIDSEASQTCTSKETPLNWNQAGPPGAPGSVRPTYVRFAQATAVARALCDAGDFGTGGGGGIIDGTGALANVGVSNQNVDGSPIGWSAWSTVSTDTLQAHIVCVDNTP